MPGPGGGIPGGRGPVHYLTEEEKQNRPKVTGALLRRILSYLRPYALQFVLVFITILISAVVGLLPSIITGRIVDEALIGRDMRLLIQLILAALATLTVSEVVGVLESYINAWISQRIIFDMKNQMYRHLQQMPQAF
ncbi:MAG: ABC transporter transmembrane domain-containing protein, partial [Oscillospiraceae bacterium]|nr:ABC transporter transmembrane domain-containing protein [Oscillospiraceae bacterium]